MRPSHSTSCVPSLSKRFYLTPAEADDEESDSKMSAPGSPRKAAPPTDAAAPASGKPARVHVELTEADIPDVIERLPKPDKAAHDAAIAKLDAEIKKLQARTVRPTIESFVLAANVQQQL